MMARESLCVLHRHNHHRHSYTVPNPQLVESMVGWICRCRTHGCQGLTVHALSLNILLIIVKTGHQCKANLLFTMHIWRLEAISANWLLTVYITHLLHIRWLSYCDLLAGPTPLSRCWWTIAANYIDISLSCHSLHLESPPRSLILEANL
jgi:hypothetical protein